MAGRSWAGQKNRLISTTTTLALGPTRPPIQWMSFFPEGKAAEVWSWQLHLWLKFRTRGSTPPLHRMPTWRIKRHLTNFTAYYWVKSLTNRRTTDSRLPRRTVVTPYCQVLTCSKYKLSCPKGTRKTFSVIKAAEALNFSNNDVALRDLSYYEIRSVKFAVGNSNIQDLNLAADTIFNWSWNFRSLWNPNMHLDVHTGLQLRSNLNGKGTAVPPWTNTGKWRHKSIHS
jgi:hypothetical protein